MKYSPSSLITRLGSSFALGLLLLGSSVQGRLWTAADGRSLEADLIEYDAAAGTVRIKRKDGKEFTLKKDSLSAGDIAHPDAIEKTAEHDPSVLYMGGMSGGAMRSYDYSARFERPWKGIVACGGWLGGPSNWDQEYTRNMAVAMINGDGDKAANSWIERDTDILKKFRCKTKTFAFPGGHVVAPPEVLLEAMKWIQSEQGTEKPALIGARRFTSLRE